MRTQHLKERLLAIMLSTTMTAAALAGCTAKEPVSSAPKSTGGTTLADATDPLPSDSTTEPGESTAPDSSASGADNAGPTGGPGTRTEAPTARPTGKPTQGSTGSTAATTTSNPSGLQTAQLVTNRYDAKDVFVAAIDVTKAPFNVDNTGKADATSAIQNAINKCQTTYGGGIVFLPKGTYKITGTLNVKSHVILKGEYNAPGKAKGDYGTVISAQTTSTVFQMNASAGVSGVTVYYPSQKLSKPVACDYTFQAKTGNFTVENVTMLNSYKGIGVCVDGTTAHGLLTFENVRGTVLNQGVSINYGAEVSTVNDLYFSPSYWASATAAYGAPSEAEILKWMASNSDSGLYLAGDECVMFSNVLIDGFRTGIYFGKTPRKDGAECYIQFYSTTVKNADVAADVRYTYWDMAQEFANCSLTGRSKAIKNSSSYAVKAFNCTLSGGTEGAVVTTSASVSIPTSVATISGPTQKKLFNAVTGYGADNSGKNDCSSAIQKALDAAKAAGGGYVYLPGGIYRLDKPITVPANTELCGANAVPGCDTEANYAATSIFCYYGKGKSATDAALITLAGKGAGCTGIRFYYPQNGVTKIDGNIDRDVDAYAYTIRGTASNVYCKNLNFYAAWYGIEMSGANNYVIRRCIGSFYKNAMHVKNCAGGFIDSCLSNNGQQIIKSYLYLDDFANWIGGSDLYDNLIYAIGQRKHDYMVFDGSTKQVVRNTFAYVPRVYLTANNSEISVVNAYGSRMGNQNALYVLSGGKLTAVNNFWKVSKLADLSNNASVAIYNNKAQQPASSEDNLVR